VLFNNRDDQARNFAYRLARHGDWRLEPCYDLSFNHGPRGQHQMPVMDESVAPTRATLLQLAAVSVRAIAAAILANRERLK